MKMFSLGKRNQLERYLMKDMIDNFFTEEEKEKYRCRWGKIHIRGEISNEFNSVKTTFLETVSLLVSVYETYKDKKKMMIKTKNGDLELKEFLNQKKIYISKFREEIK